MRIFFHYLNLFLKNIVFSNIYFKKINALLNFLQDENGELLQKMHINSLPYLEVSGILENCSIQETLILILVYSVLGLKFG